MFFNRITNSTPNLQGSRLVFSNVVYGNGRLLLFCCHNQRHILSCLYSSFFSCPHFAISTCTLDSRCRFPIFLFPYPLSGSLFPSAYFHLGGNDFASHRHFLPALHIIDKTMFISIIDYRLTVVYVVVIHLWEKKKRNILIKWRLEIIIVMMF